VENNFLLSHLSCCAISTKSRFFSPSWFDSERHYSAVFSQKMFFGGLQFAGTAGFLEPILPQQVDF
jgi:hypothetical protein